MDAALLTKQSFWGDPTPWSKEPVPQFPELENHVLFKTSGSSGVSKSVAVSKQALLTSAVAVNHHLKVTHASRWGLALPVHHVGGFGVCARAYAADCGFCEFPERWNALAFQQWSASTGITHTSLVPTQVHDLVTMGIHAPANLVAVVVGGGRLESALGEAARKLGWPILGSYGMTEASSQVATDSLDRVSISYQVGPLPLLPIWKARMNADGLLELAGPALFSGYIIDSRYVPRTTEWHTTADFVELRGQFLTMRGRADLVVKIRGKLVDPTEIERQIRAMSGGKIEVDSFAVVAITDARSGCVLVPVIQSGTDLTMVQDVLKTYQITAPACHRMSDVIELEDFPRSPLGKLLRHEIATICELRRSS